MRAGKFDGAERACNCRNDLQPERFPVQVVPLAFKNTPQTTNVPDSPEKLILDLPRRKIKGALLHQGEIMKHYTQHALSVPDVALQLPTGSGKTLVGLMIAEWRRRKFRERVVYLCPTRQLVNQVVEQAEDQYGLTIRGFVGSKFDYDPGAKADYQSGERVAVTTYSALFNRNPFFRDAHVIIVDDAHAAENYIADPWSLRIARQARPALHTAVAGLIKPCIDAANYSRLVGKWESPADLSWVDKLPTPTFCALHDEFRSLVDAHVGETDLSYAWGALRDHLDACQLYISSQEILLRPLIPPTWSHPAFANATQRIFMSATLGAGGDLERLTGRKAIQRLPVPSGWDRQGIGRRYFIFPGMSLRDDEAIDLRRALMARAGRSLVLVPSDTASAEVKSDVASALQYPVFSAEDIEQSKRPFVESKEAVAVVANRYDGIDFPGDDCRLLFVDGLPRAMNAQERFLMSRMGANALFNERIQTRVLQAIGRCTRSLEDYSAVVISGENLPSFLNDRDRRKYFHPELQAELEFGIEQSLGASVEGFTENLDIFLNNGVEWEAANNQILAKRDAAVQQAMPAMNDLEVVVAAEIEFQEKLWQKDFEGALSAAERVITKLVAPELRGYRALWHYLAGSSAWQAGNGANGPLTSKARHHFAAAKGAATGIPWLVQLSRYDASSADDNSDQVSTVFEQLERVESLLDKLGTLHDRKFDDRERQILEGLQSTEKGPFERAHELLGETLGFTVGNEESDASPDPWWIAGGICFVFEDHAGAKPSSALDATKARQAATHPNWIKANVQESAGLEIVPVLVTPVVRAESGALPHLGSVRFWALDDFRAWAKLALSVMRELRRTFTEPGDLVWRARAAEAFERDTMDAANLLRALRSRPSAAEALSSEG